MIPLFASDRAPIRLIAVVHPSINYETMQGSVKFTGSGIEGVVINYKERGRAPASQLYKYKTTLNSSKSLTVPLSFRGIITITAP